MSAPDHSIDPRILESAKKQFREKGFQGASLKEICRDAGITTGALYKRYKGKEDLFYAVVKETLDAIDDVIASRSCIPVSQLSDADLIRRWSMEIEDMIWWMEFLYAHREGFTLLLCCSEGTAWAQYEHQIASRMTEITWEYWAEACRRGLSSYQITKDELHILLSAFWKTICEPFIHDFEWSQLESYCRTICRLFHWYDALGLNPAETKE